MPAWMRYPSHRNIGGCSTSYHLRREASTFDSFQWLAGYVYTSVNCCAVQVTNHNGTVWWRQKEIEVYDRVLIDAPCSSDRHVLQQACVKRGRISSSAWCVDECTNYALMQVWTRF
jgi:hypothetical protein